jgi:tRNA-dihydrouridine synthase A
MTRPTPIFSIAPMMDWTDRHFRYLMRQVTRRALLYTEMVTTGALLYGDRARHLDFSPEESPVALQLGGDDANALAECARLGEAWGYAEINLNVGCPSERVQSGNFGACLMARPELVARCVSEMKAAVGIPVTVKHRIGVDDLDTYEDMARFVSVVAEAGADRFTVHARKAWLSGLSPKENRTVPPLRYPEVYRLKAEFPQLAVELNGGVRTLGEARRHLRHVDAVMVGRAAYEAPYDWVTADVLLFGDAAPPKTRREVVLGVLPYLESQLSEGVYLSRVARHLLNLFKDVPGAKRWRRHLSEHMHRPGAGPEVVLGALALLPETVLDARPEVSPVASP